MAKTLKDKKIAYNKVFNNELGKIVLSDLRAFCHATKTTHIKDDSNTTDPYHLALLEGRRQVFLQILNTMKVDFDDVYDWEQDY